MELLIKNNYTDKNTVHSYLDTYNKLLKPIQYDAKNILEIGISHGGSILLWHDFFINGNIYGCDIVDNIKVDNIKNNKRINLYFEDAYNEKFITENFSNNNLKFNFIIDDGPHTLESMKKFINLYLPLLEEKGIFIIEDIQNIEWFNELIEIVPEKYKEYIELYDLRKNKNRYDDLLFVINKNK